LNYCWQCKAIVDSRDCKRGITGWYICNKCGAEAPPDRWPEHLKQQLQQQEEAEKKRQEEEDKKRIEEMLRDGSILF